MMNPYISWAVVVVVASSLGWYYTDHNGKNKAPTKVIVEKTETAPAPKKQKRKAKKSPEPSPAPIKPSEKSEPRFEETDSQDEEIDKKEMAKRFTAVKNGTSSQLANGESKNQKKKKTKAVSTRNLEASNSERSASRVSTRSSTTGADADDDLSPAGSPQVNAVRPAGYVSDMLEAPAPGASVLRVTGSMESEVQKKKPKESFKQVETKKQRQQRVKNEARKQQVQEAEEQRRKLLEKQLSTARGAERREAAKITSAPQTNAWQTKNAITDTNGTQTNGTTAQVQVSQSSKVDLLDTFEPTKPAAQEWNNGLPSEEEQMRILGAANGEDAWTTVSTKKIKKKGGKGDESEASASESQPTPAVPEPVQPKVKVTPTHLPDNLRSREKGHPLDSDWAA